MVSSNAPTFSQPAPFEGTFKAGKLPGLRLSHMWGPLVVAPHRIQIAGAQFSQLSLGPCPISPKNGKALQRQKSGCKHLAMVPRSSSLRATRKLDRTSSKRRHILQEKWNKPMKQAAQRFQPFQSTPFSSALFQFEKFLRLRPALCHYPQDSTSARICSATSFTGISGIWLLQNTSCRRWKTGILNDFQLSMSSPKSLETILFRLKLC